MVVRGECDSPDSQLLGSQGLFSPALLLQVPRTGSILDNGLLRSLTTVECGGQSWRFSWATIREFNSLETFQGRPAFLSSFRGYFGRNILGKQNSQALRPLLNSPNRNTTLDVYTCYNLLML